jgi:hypothetical protein
VASIGRLAGSAVWLTDGWENDGADRRLGAGCALVAWAVLAFVAQRMIVSG